MGNLPASTTDVYPFPPRDRLHQRPVLVAGRFNPGRTGSALNRAGSRRRASVRMVARADSPGARHCHRHLGASTNGWRSWSNAKAEKTARSRAHSRCLCPLLRVPVDPPETTGEPRPKIRARRPLLGTAVHRGQRTGLRPGRMEAPVRRAEPHRHVRRHEHAGGRTPDAPIGRPGSTPDCRRAA